MCIRDRLTADVFDLPRAPGSLDVKGLQELEDDKYIKDLSDYKSMDPGKGGGSIVHNGTDTSNDQPTLDEPIQFTRVSSSSALSGSISDGERDSLSNMEPTDDIDIDRKDTPGTVESIVGDKTNSTIVGSSQYVGRLSAGRTVSDFSNNGVLETLEPANAKLNGDSQTKTTAAHADLDREDYYESPLNDLLSSTESFNKSSTSTDQSKHISVQNVIPEEEPAQEPIQESNEQQPVKTPVMVSTFFENQTPVSGSRSPFRSISSPFSSVRKNVKSQHGTPETSQRNSNSSSSSSNDTKRKSGPKIKGVFSSFVQNIKRNSQTEKRTSNGSFKISTPYNAKHMYHVGIDSKTGEYTGLPNEWEKLLTSSGITKKEQQQNPQAVMDIVKFYQDVTETNGEDKVFKTFKVGGSGNNIVSTPSFRTPPSSNQKYETPQMQSTETFNESLSDPSHHHNLQSPLLTDDFLETANNKKFIPTRPAPKPQSSSVSRVDIPCLLYTSRCV